MRIFFRKKKKIKSIHEFDTKSINKNIRQREKDLLKESKENMKNITSRVNPEKPKKREINEELLTEVKKLTKPQEEGIKGDDSRNDFWRMTPLGCGCGGWIVVILIILAIALYNFSRY